jgi:hypothetical protein
VALGLAVSPRLEGARIVVGTVDQKISSDGPCSLQEAIYSAELQSNIAIDATDPDDFITTNCTPGTGNDTIVLPPGATFSLTSFLDGDAYNPYGPTATPIIFSTITIEGHGAKLVWNGAGNVRLFAVGPASIQTPNGTVSGTGNLTIQNVEIQGFRAKGGDGLCGGGGGMGAGGAIYIQFGSLTIQNSTLGGNSATGGDGIFPCVTGGAGFNVQGGGGGGGMGGKGGGNAGSQAGGGGGGARGNGAPGAGFPGGGGGGTVFDGGVGTDGGSVGPSIGGAGGYLCGGNGGDNGNKGHGGKCPGGGGGGGGEGGDGGAGAYGGGGGGAGNNAGGIGVSNGGSGGFGGGGGAGEYGGTSGDGGFGGGGGGFATTPGSGHIFAGDGTFGSTGGGGAGLGGAIFSDSAVVTIQNSTFTGNSTHGGASNGFPGGGTPGKAGDAVGGAIFSRNGSLSVVNASVSHNQANVGGGIYVFQDGAATSLTLNDTIISGNGSDECLFWSGSASGAGNLIMNNASAAPCPGVVTSTDPKLGPLADNGGDTRTMAIPLGSSAMSNADSATSLSTDQRGEPRPEGLGWDIGAYEICRLSKFVATPCRLPTLNLFALPAALIVDDGGINDDINGVLEPGETVSVKPTWKNVADVPVTLTGTASGLMTMTASGSSHSPGPTYDIVDASADYGTIAVGASDECADCYAVQVSKPAVRPATHWDATFTEIPSTGDPAKAWTLHIGDSFTDVPRSHLFYKKIETLLHRGITSGCTPTTYCPASLVARSQMAIFIARGLARGAPLPVSGTVGGSPYNCAAGGVSLFSDVAATDPACRAVHYIASKNVTSGCSPGLFCPTPDVARSDMAIFLAKALVAPAGGAGVPETYGPDPVTGYLYSCNPASASLHFTDVTTADPFCKHVHYLWAKGIVSGCSTTAYCPSLDVARDEMAKFLANTFGLVLYGP